MLVTSGAPRLRGRGPAPPWTWAGGARADETCSVHKHATWPASCSLKPSRCTKRPLPCPELEPAQGPGCGTRRGSSLTGLVTSLPSGTWGAGGSGNSRGDRLPGAGRSPHVLSLPGCLCRPSYCPLHTHCPSQDNGRPPASTAQTSQSPWKLCLRGRPGVWLHVSPPPPPPAPLLALGWDMRDPESVP